MFLEETIGSLDAEAESGGSTDATDHRDPSKLPRTHPKRDSIPQDMENGARPPSRGQQRAAEQMSGKSISSSPSTAPAVAPSPGCSTSVVPDAERASRAPATKVTVNRAEDPVSGTQSSQEMAKEDRFDQANTRNQMKSMESLIIQPPDPFQDEPVSHEWSQSNRSDGKGETAKETKTWTSGAQPEKSTLEEASQDTDAKRGPPTAPKPRKLPPNIILKTSKTSPVPLATEPGQKVKAASPPSGGSQPSDTTAERANLGHLDPKEREKAHREALVKLGLSEKRKEPGTHLQPALPSQQKAMPFPVPKEPSGEALLPPTRQMNFKSNTLERSGVGLGSCMASTKEQNVKSSSSLGKMSFMERLAPSFLRSSRPRPASLGMGKDFGDLKEPGEVEQEKSNKRRSHPLPSIPRPPRPSVSVKIVPKGATEENRREALKKLGLLKE
ncbi:specifically androgen-regulated gene protein isoform X2 [Calypte anna]|nr:specifically androgen-regulated gene protein isoform X2 [Calypte anna]XP_030321528.1 specifically androgen-regulated gene protein isoform X2 [Calypte anna]